MRRLRLLGVPIHRALNPTPLQPGDVYIDHAVPIFNDGVPTTQCQVSSGGPIQAGITVTDNSFWQDAGQSAVYGYSIDGALVTGNTVTRAPGSATPQFDLVCSACVSATAADNFCDGVACSQSGF